jgi:hypothetical protein
VPIRTIALWLDEGGVQGLEGQKEAERIMGKYGLKRIIGAEKMKLLYALLALAFLAMPGIAMNETDVAYLEGIQDGYALGYAAIVGQQEPAYELAYNQGVAILNGWMDTVGYTGQRWENLSVTRNSYVLPAGLR